MPELIITRGLPASGKSSYAKALAQKDPHYKILELDGLREELGLKPGKTTKALIRERNNRAISLLNKGYSVILADTNLCEKSEEAAKMIAEKSGVKLRYKDFTYVSVDECIRRDALRGDKKVGAHIIRSMARTYLQ